MNRRNRTTAILVAFATALIALSVAGTAQAFDSNSCPLPVDRTDRFYIEAGKVDFGDHLHLNGVPRGDAVICWSGDGRVAMKGVVFSDPGIFFPDNQYATARIWFFDDNAGLWRSQGSFSTALSNSLQSRTVGGLDGVVSPAGNFTRVRIRLSLTTEGGLGGLSTSIITTRTFDR